MGDAAWKARERKAAALFGAARAVLSGSSGREDRSCSDSTHPRLFVETKLRAAHTAWALWRKVKVLAIRERKTPVLALAEKGRYGLLIVCHEDDLLAVAREVLASRPDDEVLEFEHQVARLRGGES